MMCPPSGGKITAEKERIRNVFTGRGKSLSLTVDLTR